MEFSYNRNDFNIQECSGKIWLNKRRKLGFLKIPKCSGTSICNTLKTLKYVCLKENAPKDFTLFSVIRNPVTRLISGYIEIIQDCRDYPGGRFRHNIIKEFKGHNIYVFLHNLQISKETNVEKFLRFFEKIEKEFKFFDGHIAPYSFFLSDENKKLCKNIKLFKLEEMKELEDFFKVKIPRHNTCENNKLKVELLDYIENNEDIKNRIVELYKDDYKLYNSI